MENGFLLKRKDNFNKAGVYKIENIQNNHAYIGSTKCLYTRLHAHLSTLQKRINPNKKLQEDFNKYGICIFQTVVLEFCINRREREQYYIDRLNPEYNIGKDANAPMKGRNHSKETREKLSERNRGTKLSEEHKKKIAPWGRKDSEETKKRKQLSQPHRKRVSKFTLNDVFVETYETIAEAARKNNINTSDVSMCISGKLKQTHGYKYKHEIS